MQVLSLFCFHQFQDWHKLCSHKDSRTVIRERCKAGNDYVKRAKEFTVEIETINAGENPLRLEGENKGITELAVRAIVPRPDAQEYSNPVNDSEDCQELINRIRLNSFC